MTEEFEEWAQSKAHDVAHSKHHDDRYYSMITQNLWEAWQARQPEIDALKVKTTKILTETAEKVEIIPFYDEELRKAADATLRLIDERFFTHLSVFTEDREIVENLRAVLEKIKATEEHEMTRNPDTEDKSETAATALTADTALTATTALTAKLQE